MTSIKNLIIAFTIATVVSCGNGPSADQTTPTNEQQEAQATGASYTIDTAASIVTWVGTKPTGQHTGTLSISEGSVSVDAGKITAGNFTININSLKNSDLDADGKAKLEGHLKSPDFFDAAKFPTAKFTISAVEAYDSTKTKSMLAGATHVINGNLTLKDSTKNISFPAKIDIQANALKVSADFNIDRTQWGMFYGSDASIQDKFISHEVNLKLDIKAKN